MLTEKLQEALKAVDEYLAKKAIEEKKSANYPMLEEATSNFICLRSVRIREKRERSKFTAISSTNIIEDSVRNFCLFGLHNLKSFPLENWHSSRWKYFAAFSPFFLSFNSFILIRHWPVAKVEMTASLFKPVSRYSLMCSWVLGRQEHLFNHQKIPLKSWAVTRKSFD